MATVANTTNGPDESAFHGISQGANAIAIYGQGVGVGVRGNGGTWHGVHGTTESTTGGAGVMGQGIAGGPGVIGTSLSVSAYFSRSGEVMVPFHRVSGNPRRSLGVGLTTATPFGVPFSFVISTIQ